jgi:hypothetical protein
MAFDLDHAPMAHPARSKTPLWDKGPNDKRLLKFLLSHCAVGLIGGLLFCVLFLVLDIAGLRSVLFATREAGLAIFMFCFATAFMFGAVAMGVGVMTLPRDWNYGHNAGRTRRQIEDDRPAA